MAPGTKVWAFTAQSDGETVGPYIFLSRPSAEHLKKTVTDDFEGYDPEEVWGDLYRHALSEVEVHA